MKKAIFSLISMITATLPFTLARQSMAEDRNEVLFNANKVSLPIDVKYISDKDQVTNQETLGLLIPSSRFNFKFEEFGPAKKEYEFVSISASIPPGFDVNQVKQKVLGRPSQPWRNYDTYDIGSINKVYVAKTNTPPSVISCVKNQPMLCQAITNVLVFLNGNYKQSTQASAVYSFLSNDMNSIDELNAEVTRVIHQITKP